MTKKILIFFIPLIILFFIYYFISKQNNEINSLIPFLPQKNYLSDTAVIYDTNYERYNKIVEKAVKSSNPDICDEINFGQDLGDYRTSVDESRYFAELIMQ